MDSLIQFHQNHGAELDEIEGITIPIRYINRFQEERQTLIRGAGILDHSSMMLISVKRDGCASISPGYGDQ
jgi:Glycine cleavage system T protein (aminomethyltransferase)